MPLHSVTAAMGCINNIRLSRLMLIACLKLNMVNIPKHNMQVKRKVTLHTCLQPPMFMHREVDFQRRHRRYTKARPIPHFRRHQEFPGCRSLHHPSTFNNSQTNNITVLRVDREEVIKATRDVIRTKIIAWNGVPRKDWEGNDERIGAYGLGIHTWKG